MTRPLSTIAMGSLGSLLTGVLMLSWFLFALVGALRWKRDKSLPSPPHGLAAPALLGVGACGLLVANLLLRGSLPPAMGVVLLAASLALAMASLVTLRTIAPGLLFYTLFAGNLGACLLSTQMLVAILAQVLFRK